MKEIGPRDGRASLAAPLDPPCKQPDVPHKTNERLWCLFK